MISDCTEHEDSVVVYTGKNCPVCKMQVELTNLTTDLERAKDEIKELENNAKD